MAENPIEAIQQSEADAVHSMTKTPGWQVFKRWAEEEQLREMKRILDGKKEDLIWKRIGYVNGIRRVFKYVEMCCLEVKTRNQASS